MAENKTEFEALSDDVLLHIMLFIDQDDFYKFLMINKRLRGIGSSPVFFRKFCVRVEKFFNDDRSYRINYKEQTAQIQKHVDLANAGPLAAIPNWTTVPNTNIDPAMVNQILTTFSEKIQTFFMPIPENEAMIDKVDFPVLANTVLFNAFTRIIRKQPQYLMEKWPGIRILRLGYVKNEGNWVSEMLQQMPNLMGAGFYNVEWGTNDRLEIPANIRYLKLFNVAFERINLEACQEGLVELLYGRQAPEPFLKQVQGCTNLKALVFCDVVNNSNVDSLAKTLVEYKFFNQDTLFMPISLAIADHTDKRNEFVQLVQKLHGECGKLGAASGLKVEIISGLPNIRRFQGDKQINILEKLGRMGKLSTFYEV